MPSTSQCAVDQLPTPVNIGGSSATSFTAYAPICGGTTTTGALQSAATGISSSGYVLTSTGSSSLPTFQAVPPIVLIKTLTASNSASIIFGSSYITSAYSNYMVLFSNLTPVTSTDNIRMVVSINNGSNWIATNYQSGRLANTYTNSSWGNVNSTTFIDLTGNGAGQCTGQLFLQNVSNGATFQMNGTTTNIDNGPYTDLNLTVATNTATNVNAIKFTASTGNINTGTFSLYGIVQ